MFFSFFLLIAFMYVIIRAKKIDERLINHLHQPRVSDPLFSSTTRGDRKPLASEDASVQIQVWSIYEPHEQCGVIMERGQGEFLHRHKQRKILKKFSSQKSFDQNLAETCMQPSILRQSEFKFVQIMISRGKQSHNGVGVEFQPRNEQKKHKNMWRKF